VKRFLLILTTILIIVPILYAADSPGSQIDKGKAFIGRNPGIYNAQLVEPPDYLNITLETCSHSYDSVFFTIQDVKEIPIEWSVEIDDGGKGWLLATPLPLVSFSPTTLTIKCNPEIAANLQPGEYTGQIHVTAPVAINSPLDINIRLSVSTVIDPPGDCGDANYDGTVNVSDAVWIINFVFAGGDPPRPVLACGDANNDEAVNVSDAVFLINYVFAGNQAPFDCSFSSSFWIGEDCGYFCK
jgi:Dockerin type I domain